MKLLSMPNFFPGFVNPVNILHVREKAVTPGTVEVVLANGEIGAHDFKSHNAAQEWMTAFQTVWAEAASQVVAPGFLREDHP